MRITAISVSEPKSVQFNGKEILTSFFKKPVLGSVNVLANNLAGDKAADLRVHGTPNRAVYAYSLQAYAWWRENSQFKPETNAAEFGENFTVDGLCEKEAYVGDILQIGECQIQVTEPRQPCFKIGIKFGSPKMITEFIKSPHSGVYYRILKPGQVHVGDEMKLISSDPVKVSISELFEIYGIKKVSKERAQAISACKSLTEGWQQMLIKYQI